MSRSRVGARQRISAAVTNSDDAVGVLEWHSAMSNEETSFIPEVLAKVIHYQYFGDGIESGSRFIQNQNGGVLQQGAGERQALPFARGKAAAAGPMGSSRPSSRAATTV